MPSLSLALVALLLGAACGRSSSAPGLTSISVAPATKTLKVAQTAQLAVTGSYDDGTTAALTTGVGFQSSAPAIATVSDTGLVTAVAAGNTTITATETVSGKSATAAITVQPAGTPGQLIVFDDNYGPGLSFNPFAGSSNPPVLDTVEHHTGTTSLKIVVPASGYTGGAFKVAPPADMTAFNAVTFWAKASAAKTIDKVGLGNDATHTTYQAEWLSIAVTTTWTKYVMPIPLPSKLTAEGGAFHYAIGAGQGSFTVWLDDVQYETLPGATLGVPTASIATSTLNKAVGDTFAVDGLGASFPVSGTQQAIVPAAAYFTFASSNTSVATVDAAGLVHVVGDGSADITASLGSVAATGKITVNVAGNNAPAAAPAAPTAASTDVISLLSSAYTNSPVDKWLADWTVNVSLADVTVGADAVKKYTFGTGGYVGIEFTTHTLDLSQMGYFHADVWTPDAASFKVKLVDFGANGVYSGGDDTAGELTFDASSTPALTHGAWVALEIPLSSFVSAGLTATPAHLAQMVLSSASSTVYVDNLYFHKGAPPPPPPAAAVIFDDAYAPGVSFSAFGGSTNDVSVDTAEHHSGTSSLKVVLPSSGYTGGALSSSANVDLSAYNAITFWAKASSNVAFDTVGIGNDNTATTPYAAEWHAVPLTTTWTRFVVPIPLPSAFTSIDGLFHFATGPQAGVTVWFDDIQYEALTSTELGTPQPAIATETVSKTVGDTFAIDGPSVVYFLNGSSTAEVVALPAKTAWLTLASSNPSAVTVDSSTATASAVGAGSADITAKLGAIDAAGKITVNVAGASQPSAAPAAPTAASTDVLSLLTTVYTNHAVDTWRTGWSDATLTEVTVGSDAVKKYSSLNFVGIEFYASSNEIDATPFAYFHVDVWTPDATSVSVKLVDFGANGTYDGGGDDTAGQVTYNGASTPALVTGQWVSLDIPLSAFVSAGLTASPQHLAQLLFVASQNTVYVDNVYFHK